MNLLTDDEIVADKLARIRALSDAIIRARQAVLDEKTAAAAISLSQLQRQRQQLRATMPELRLVD